MRKIVCFCLVVVSFMMFDRVSFGATFEEALNALSASLPSGADIASMGGVQTMEGFTSSNPAVTSIMKEGKFSSTLNYGDFVFEKTNLQMYSASFGAKTGELVVQLGAGYAKTPLRSVTPLQSLKIENTALEVQIGGRVAKKVFFKEDEFYLGAGYGFSQNKISGLSIVPTPATTFVTELETNADCHSAKIGLAYKPFPNLLLGASGSRAWSFSQTAYNGFKDEAVGMHTDTSRVGFSLKVTDLTMLAADYQHLDFSNSDTKFDQLFAGIEQYVIKDALALYAGYANGGVTGGAGIYFKQGGINLSYGHNLFRETKEFLGNADAYMVSVYLNF